MLRTLKVSLPADPVLVQTAIAFNHACQIALDYGSQHKTSSKNRLNRGTYHQIRKTLPYLPSALVQTARDQASEILRTTGCGAAAKKRLSVRYDKRTFKFYPDQDRASLTTVRGRLSFPFKHYAYLDTWRGTYTNAQLIIRKGRAFLNVQVEIRETGKVEVASYVSGGVLGIDRGVHYIAVCSDNTFFGSSKLRTVKGRYQHLRSVLQRVGTRSAHRKLSKVSGSSTYLPSRNYMSESGRRMEGASTRCWAPGLRGSCTASYSTRRKQEEKLLLRLTRDTRLSAAHAAATQTSATGMDCVFTACDAASSCMLT
jgi:predicted transposase